LVFTVSGRRIALTPDDVRRAVVEVAPEPARTHVVTVDGREYPVKRVFAAATGMDLLDFTTNQARRVLDRLGFDLRRLS